MIKRIIKKAKRLRAVSSEVKDFSKVQKLLANMMSTLVSNRGVGLAAIQIGVPKRVIWVTVKKQGKEFFQAMINPVITSSYSDNDKLVDSYEGCLSFPGKFGHIKRHFYTHVSFQNVKAEWKHVILIGEEAFIAQHEIDHLDGVLCIDKFF